MSEIIKENGTQKRYDVLCIGEMLADIIVSGVKNIRFDAFAEKADEIRIRPGGDAFNNAIDLAKLGNRVCCAGRFSTDVIGEHLLSLGREAGIDMSHVIRTETPQAKMTILIKEDEGRAFFYYPGTSTELCAEDIDLSLLDQCRLLQIGSTFHLTGFDGEGAAHVLREAQSRGVITSMDVTSDLSGRWDSVIRCCYPHLDYFLPSIEQAEKIAGTSDERQIADYFLSAGVRNVVIKLGARGSYFRSAEEEFRCGTCDVPVRDSTGAGDAFVSGFLTGVLQGMSHPDCARLGTACAACVIQEVGANAGIRSLEETLAFLREKGQPDITVSFIEKTPRLS